MNARLIKNLVIGGAIGLAILMIAPSLSMLQVFFIVASTLAINSLGEQLI
jgi:hypothetical protein